MAGAATILSSRARLDAQLPRRGDRRANRADGALRDLHQSRRRRSSRAGAQIEDRDRRWQGPWFPQRGDLVDAAIGYAGEPIVSCGSFQVDEVELTGAPDVMHLRCIAAYVTPAMRTRNSTAHESQTLLGIANQIAAKYGFSVVGAAVNPDVSFERITQSHEMDLAFLKRIAEAHNYEFTMRGTQIVFYSRPALEQRPSLGVVHRSDVTRFQFRAKTHRIYKAAQVSYYDPATKQLITQTATASPAPPTGDTLKIVQRCENGQQAALKAAAALHRNNMLQVTGEVEMPGTTAYPGGGKLTAAGFGEFDGDYFVKLARHRLLRDRGYTTELSYATPAKVEIDAARDWNRGRAGFCAHAGARGFSRSRSIAEMVAGDLNSRRRSPTRTPGCRISANRLSA